MDGETPGRGTTAVDEEGGLFGGGVIGKGESERLIEGLSDAAGELVRRAHARDGEEILRCDADTEGSGLLETQILGNLDLDVSLGDDVVLESSVLVIHLVSSVGKTAHSVTLLEWFCDFASYFLDDSCVIAADLYENCD